ncbi:MAG: GNAT family N-acetyltransferase [Candidatus Theseobacter exili]|nr:GNAT family N-acetyltransferase [Candidatus Theseobacter exili]
MMYEKMRKSFRIEKLKLKNGETMEVIEVLPGSDLAEGVSKLLGHKNRFYREDIKNILAGSNLADSEHRFFVGRINGELVGNVWIGMRTHGPHFSELGHVYISPKHRSKGISTVLMKHAMERLKEFGVEACHLRTGNPVARQLYLKYGFFDVLGHGMWWIPGGEGIDEFCQRIFTVNASPKIRRCIPSDRLAAFPVEYMSSWPVAPFCQFCSFEHMVKIMPQVTYVAETQTSTIVGWSSCRYVIGAGTEGMMELLVTCAKGWTEVVTSLANAAIKNIPEEIDRIYYLGIEDLHPIEELKGIGFVEECRLVGTSHIDGSIRDLVILKRTLKKL